MRKFLFFLIFCLTFSSSQCADLFITVKDVEVCNITVRPFRMGITQDPIFQQTNVRSNEQVHCRIPDEFLPGEFVVRYDYAQEPGQNLYPSEQQIIVNKQDLIWSVNPIFCNNHEKTWFQSGEVENTVLYNFNQQLEIYKSKILVLQQFLMNYNGSSKKLIRLSKKEYEKIRIELNDMISEYSLKHSGTFARSFFQLNAIPKGDFTGNFSDNFESLRNHFFDEVNITDSLIIRINGFTTMLNNFVNLCAENAQLSDQNEVEAFYASIAKEVIEKFKGGHPLVYGFVVDYFYIGFERNNFMQAMQVLYPYLGDPFCKTAQRLALEKRLAGSKTLIIDGLAPDFIIDGQSSFLSLPTDAKFKLLVFWSADCAFCEEEIPNLVRIYNLFKESQTLEIVAVSLDETEYEVSKWNEMKNQLMDWKHLRPEGGIESIPCKNYFITSTPSMFLIDSKTNKLVLIPKNTQDLQIFLNQN